MTTKWYYQHEGQQLGPVSPEQLKQLAASGQLQPMDLVWKEELANWVPASKIKGLFQEAPRYGDYEPVPSQGKPVPPPMTRTFRPIRKAASTPSGVARTLFVSMLSPSLEEYGKRLGLLLGIVLIVGTLLPVFTFGPDGLKLYFLNIQGLWEEHAGIPKFFLLYPLIAGIGSIILVNCARGYTRSLVLIAMGLLPWLVMPALDRTGPIDDTLQRVSGTVLVIFTLIGIFVGFRIQRGDPGTAFGRYVAGGCGSLLLLLTILPLLPDGTVPLVAPFKLMDVDILMGLVALVVVAGLVTISVIGCCTIPANPQRSAQFALLANRILFIILIVTPLLPAYYSYWQLLEHKVIGVFAFLTLPLLYTVKGEALVYGLVALLAVGVIDFYSQLPAGWFSQVSQWFQQLQAQAAQEAYTVDLVDGLEDVEQHNGPAQPIPGELQHAADGQPPQASAESLAARAKLEQLQELSRDGLISEEDFEKRKQQILDKVTGGSIATPSQPNGREFPSPQQEESGNVEDDAGPACGRHTP